MKPYNKERGRGEKGRGGGNAAIYSVPVNWVNSGHRTQLNKLRSLAQVIVQADLHYRQRVFSLEIWRDMYSLVPCPEPTYSVF